MLKDFLGISNRKVLFNFGIMRANKVPQEVGKALLSLQRSMPELLFIQIGKGADVYAKSQNVLGNTVMWSNI
jgi:hypothetical protein